MAETKFSSVVIDQDLLESIQRCMKYISRFEFDSNNMRLRQSQTGIGPATDLIVPVELTHPESTEKLKVDIVINITDYSKF